MNETHQRILGAVLSVVVVVVGSAYLITQKQRSSSEYAANAETRDLVAAVGKLVSLPSGEPKIRTVTDVSELKKHSFFAQVQLGDRVLLYAEAGKAFIYNPRSNRIVQTVNLPTQSTRSQ
jgi:UPF0288 family protein (methanogenesis marker protein 3)